MGVAADSLPGITIDVDDLVAVRGQLGGLTLQHLRRRSSFRSGARETRVRGRGMEYEESRAYSPGDDVRTMDWRVMARTGEAHTKVFAEEKERRFLLAVDLSASMFFGTRYAFKSWAAAQAAAHVGWLASLAGDRLGGLIAAPAAHQEIRPGRYRSGLMSVFHQLAALADVPLPLKQAPGRFDFLLAELLRVTRPGATIALVSDFIGIGDTTAEQLAALVRHNEVHAFWIFDQSEVQAWPSGCYPLFLGERRCELEVDGGDGAGWLGRCQQQHRDAIENLTRRYDIPLYPIGCNEEVGGQLQILLKA